MVVAGAAREPGRRLMLAVLLLGKGFSWGGGQESLFLSCLPPKQRQPGHRPHYPAGLPAPSVGPGLSFHADQPARSAGLQF